VSDRLYFALNAVAFQALWFGCVLGAGGHGLTALAIGAALPIVALSLWSDSRRLDWQLAGICVAAGMLLDNLWVFLDIFDYPDSLHAPLWIGVLWLGFGLTINHSLAWFRDKRLLGPLIVGACAPITYLAGQRFGAVSIDNAVLLSLVSAAWMILFYSVSAVVRAERSPELT
jgi:hypothetical protein